VAVRGAGCGTNRRRTTLEVFGVVVLGMNVYRGEHFVLSGLAGHIIGMLVSREVDCS
jgi:hypothetical protein